VQRSSLFVGLYTGLAVPLAASFVVGVGLPFAFHGVETSAQATTLALMLGIGVLLTFVFVALAALVATLFQNKVQGLAAAVLGWLFFAVLYDGLVLLLVNAFSQYPLEKPMIGLTLLNPVDLARVLLILQFDISALMGYTGAVFQTFFGSAWGMGIAFGALMLWLVVPLGLTLRAFRRRDF
jgi:Cu-processing system permease protein